MTSETYLYTKDYETWNCMGNLAHVYALEVINMHGSKGRTAPLVVTKMKEMGYMTQDQIQFIDPIDVV